MDEFSVNRELRDRQSTEMTGTPSVQSEGAPKASFGTIVSGETEGGGSTALRMTGWLPKYVFLDTNILDAQNYNFNSVALRTFKDAARATKVTLLLPDPISREIRRHIRERSADALKALNDARRAAPFLSKWEHFPKNPEDLDWQVTGIALTEWRQFLQPFDVELLNYEGVDPAKVMEWYDEGVPPFGTKKKFEFPDAFAVAILDKYAADHSCVIAVVSQDPDMKLACEPRTAFLHFQSLPQLTELLVAGGQNVTALRELTLQHVHLVHAAVEAELSHLFFHHVDRYLVDASDFKNLDLAEIRIVALGHGEATLAFAADVTTNHHLMWLRPDSEDEWARGTVSEVHMVHGTAKVVLDPKTQGISFVTSVSLEERGFTVTPKPEPQ